MAINRAYSLCHLHLMSQSQLRTMFNNLTEAQTHLLYNTESKIQEANRILRAIDWHLERNQTGLAAYYLERVGFLQRSLLALKKHIINNHTIQERNIINFNAHDFTRYHLD